MLNQLSDAHATAKAQFGKLAEAGSMLDKARVELTSLTRLGDMITPEDVIKGAGKLVAGGLSPMAVAKLLSDMPEQGQQLQAWVAQHADQLTQREQQLEPVLAQARQQLGVAAMRSLVGHSMMPQQVQAMPQAQAQPSPSPSPALNPLVSPNAS